MKKTAAQGKCHDPGRLSGSRGLNVPSSANALGSLNLLQARLYNPNIHLLHNLDDEPQALHERVRGHAEHAVRRGTVVDAQDGGVGVRGPRPRGVEGEGAADEWRELLVDGDGGEGCLSQAVGREGDGEGSAGRSVGTAQGRSGWTDRAQGKSGSAIGASALEGRQIRGAVGLGREAWLGDCIAIESPRWGRGDKRRR